MSDVDTAQWHNLLNNYCQDLHLPVSDQQIDQLLAYLGLLIKWNSAYNLTSVRDPEEMLYRHLFDSLSIAPWVKGKHIADVGTGPGLPGIPLAILYPEKQFLLMDSNGKKTRFLTQCQMELKLTNIVIENGRVEKYHPAQLQDQILSRAFSALVNMVTWTEHMLAEGGEFVAMKGLYPEEELAALPSHIQLKAVEKLRVPHTDSERHLVFLNVSNTLR